MKTLEVGTFRNGCGTRMAVVVPATFSARTSLHRPCSSIPRSAPRRVDLNRRRLRITREGMAKGAPAVAPLPGHPVPPETTGAHATPTALFYIITLLVSVPLVDVLARICGF